MMAPSSPRSTASSMDHSLPLSPLAEADDDASSLASSSSVSRPARSRPPSAASSLARTQLSSDAPTTTRPSVQRHSSVFSRLSSSGGAAAERSGNGLRDTLFSKRPADPLDEAVHDEFSLTVIDESGDMPDPVAEILVPRTGCCARWSAADGYVLALGVVVVGATLAATLVTDELDGYAIDPGLVFGSFQTLVLGTVVFVTYHGVQSFQMHPNPLILFKCVVDILLALRFLLDPFLLDARVYVAGDRLSCSWLSGVTQCLLFASDCWYFALIVDLYRSLTNPFTSVQANRRTFALAVSLSALTSGAVTVAVDAYHGFADGNYCWTHRGDAKERDFWKINVASWVLFYNWMIVFYLAGIAVLVLGVRRLRSGLRLTLETRREMLRNGAISIMSYTAYWTFAFFWYAVSFSARTNFDEDGHMRPSPVFRAYTYTLAGRGVVDFFVWFMINPPSRLRAEWLRFSGESVDTKFSAQLNTALQRELILYTIEGMTAAVHLADREFAEQLVAQTHDDQQHTQPQPSPSSDDRRDSNDEKRKFSILTVPGEAAGASGGTMSTTHASPVPVTTTTVPDVKHKKPRGSGQQSVRFTSYKAAVFAELRHACGVSTDAFLRSFESSTKPTISEGASGAFLFFSGDKRFIVKSMAEGECRFLSVLAESYVEYLIRHPNSLITKFYGCFKITLYGKRFYFVVMENLFDVMERGVPIHHRFDIKGSWVNRSYSRPRRGAKVKCRHCSMTFRYGARKSTIQCPNVVGPHEPNVVLKDNDLRTRMRIGGDAGRELYEQLRADSLFLRDHGIMDYSLLLGVTNLEFWVDPPANDDTDDDGNAQHPRRNTATSAATAMSRLRETTLSIVEPSDGTAHSSSSDSSSDVNNLSMSTSRSDRSSRHTAYSQRSESSSTRRAVATPSVRSMAPSMLSLQSSDEHDGSYDRAGAGADLETGGLEKIVEPPPRRSIRKSERVLGPGYYYIGIIDILQQWTTQKKLERFWKVTVQRADPDGLSAIDPVAYQARFEDKLREVIAIPKEYERQLRKLRRTRMQQQQHADAPVRSARAATNNGATAAAAASSVPMSGAGAMTLAELEPSAVVVNVDGAIERTSVSLPTTDDDVDFDDALDIEQSTQNPEPILMTTTSATSAATIRDPVRRVGSIGGRASSLSGPVMLASTSSTAHLSQRSNIV